MTSINKIFSYSLFEPRIMPSHREWDKNKTDKKRYWYNIPTILFLNKILYPDYKTRFYLSTNIWENPLSKIFEYFDNIEVETIRRDYSLTEPAIWRMMPLWQWDVDIFHARDLDSLTSIEEYKYIKIFENSQCCVGTIRSHENHFGQACKMLAGLCSFKPDFVPDSVKGLNFDLYYAQKQNSYGSDQNLLIETFTSDREFVKFNFLDCKINRQSNEQDFECIKADLKSIIVDEEVQNLFNIIKNTTKTSWLGEPCDSRGELLNYLLTKNKVVKNKFLADKYVADFYMVKE